MKAYSLLGLPAPLLLLLGLAHGDQLPYNPTRIFRSPQNERVAYVLRPVSESNSGYSLASLDLSSKLSAASLHYTTLFPSLPFSGNQSSAPLNAVIDGGGNITVYAGGCAAKTSPQLWRLSPNGQATNVGSWKEENLNQAAATQSSGLLGSNFLATGIAFSSDVSSTERDTTLYFFGGMCPFSNATSDQWMSSANYSSSMLTYSPKVAKNVLIYKEGTTAERTQPIPLAGHSITQLDPTYANRPDGTSTQQQDFVLLGGHTQRAFLNMSQVALFSLPQEAWTYFPVRQPSDNGHTDLTRRQSVEQISPRSGHTAVLSEDGKKIVLLGGWVGDVHTPATPQLAVLNVGAGYGGQDDWSWTIPPSPPGPGISKQGGIYGQGVTMLPGNVMLVVGGYSITTATASNKKRASLTNTLNTKAYLYNITSNKWVSDYTTPLPAPISPPSSTATTNADTGPLSTSSQKAGLGAGLGIGAAAVAGLFIFYLWYRRRLRRQRKMHEKEMSSQSYTTLPYGSDEWGIAIPYSLGTNPDMDTERATPHNTYSGPYPITRPGTGAFHTTSAQDAARTGLLVEIPSPTRGLRRNIQGRGLYPYEKRVGRNMDLDNIHPIVEGDEDDAVLAGGGSGAEAQGQKPALRANSPGFDPFAERARDTLRSSPVSAEGRPQTGRSAKDREQEVQGWLTGWEKAAEALTSAPEMTSTSLHPMTGWGSPSKSERTSSTLSDHSAHSSTMSYVSNAGGGVTGLARSLSTRSAAFLNSLTSSFGGSGGTVSPTSDKSQYHSGAHASLPSQQARGNRSSTTTTGASPPSANQRSEGDHFTMARTSFAHLQAEGEALLGGSPQHSRYQSEPRAGAREKKGVSWVGSVKRALSGGYATAGTSPTTPTPSSARSGLAQSPTQAGHPSSTGASTPRRATSEAGFWKGRRGARDWETQVHSPGASMDSTIRGTERMSNMSAAEEDDWDVERAAEGRVVQLMFTVPRQRLRVVNVDVDGRSLISFDDESAGKSAKGKSREGVTEEE